MPSLAPSSQRQNAIGALLRAIDNRDLLAMERCVETLRGCLAAPAGAASLESEQIDALDGAAQEIERSLRRMRTAAAGEMARIRAAAPLLEHIGLEASLSQQ
jgi:hypothetical protein